MLSTLKSTVQAEVREEVRKASETLQKETLQELRMKNKLAVDQLQIAENRALKILFKEFPPNRRERLQRKFFPDLNEQQKPFTF